MISVYVCRHGGESQMAADWLSCLLEFCLCLRVVMISVCVCRHGGESQMAADWLSCVCEWS